VIPEIQLMLRVERDAKMQRRPAGEDRGDFAAYELIRPSVQATNRFKHLVGRFTIGSHTMKMQNRGTLQCKCGY
jgi:hypothetical protein